MFAKSHLIHETKPATPSFQFTRLNPLRPPSVPCHKNFLLRESFSLSTHFGIRKNDKKYVGMAKSTTLIIVILPPIVLNIGQYTGISTEIRVFYSKRYDKCKILPDIVLDRMGRYIAAWLIYRPISEMKISDISSCDAFKELLQTHLRSFYKM